MEISLRNNIIIFFIFSSCNSLFGQDPNFSQFYASALYYNPASCGLAGLPRLFLNYRNQYPSLGNAFVTYSASYDKPVKSMGGGLGISFLNDALASGSISNSSADVIYSHRFKVSQKITIQAGLQISFLFHSLNAPKFKVLTDPETLNSKLIAQPDYSTGVIAYGRDYQIGLAFHHLNTGYVRFNYDYINFPIKVSLIAMKNIHFYNSKKINNNEFIVTPGILIERQAQSFQVNAGSSFTKNNLTLGIWIRDLVTLQFNSAIFSVGYTFNNLKIIYSYDYDLRSVSGVMPYTGAHEVSLVILFSPDPTRKRYGPISCPDIQD